MTTTTPRSKIRKAGAVAAAVGIVLAVAGVAMAPAGAREKVETAEKVSTKVRICHAADAVKNPYQSIEVDLAAVGGPDHSTHLGPVFDPAVNTSNKIPWGDIIPDGLNWTAAGIAIWENDCELPAPVDQCPELDGFQTVEDDCDDLPPVDVCPDVEGVQLSPLDCLPVLDFCPDLEGVQLSPLDCIVFDPCLFVDCTPDPVDVCPDVEGLQTDEAECEVPEEPVDVCPDVEGVQTDEADCETPQKPEGEEPEGEQPTDACPNLAGIQASSSECPPVQVGGAVVTKTPAPVTVLAATLTAPAPAPAAAALPRTGSNTTQLVQLGFGLVLLGAGAVLFGREHAIA